MPFSIYLIFPPMWSPKQPYLSLPSLTAYLKKSGFTVKQRDLNIETFNYFLKGERIDPAVAKIKDRIECLEKRPFLTTAGVNEYTALARAETLAPYIQSHLDRANGIIRDQEDFFIPEKFSRARRIQNEALKIISSAYYPTIFDFFKLQFKHPYFESRAVREAVQDRESNFLIPFFREHVVPDLCQEKPDLLGISICSPDQLIPAVTLAYMIKQTMPELPVYAGGGFYTNIFEGKMALKPETFFLDLFDGVVIYEGEISLAEVCRALASGDRDGLKKIPNLIQEENGAVRVSESIVCEKMDDLPTPDFSGFPLDAYFSPEPVLPLLTSRGCYWKRCAFCTSFDSYNAGFRQRSIERLLSDIRSLQAQYGTNCIFFADQAVTPVYLKNFATALMREKIGIQWAFEGRFERQYTGAFLRSLREAGCIKILFGLESGNQRILDLMDKGYKLEVVSRILGDCSAAEIAVHLFLIIGFPTETRQEAEDTLHFLLNREGLLNSPGFSHVFHKFGLDLGSQVSKNPVHFGISDAHVPSGRDLSFMMAYNQQAPGALTEEEMEALIGAFDARISEKTTDRGYPRSMVDDLLYLIRYGWQESHLNPKTPEAGEIPWKEASRFLNMKPGVSRHLTVLPFRVFAPSGEADDEAQWRARGDVYYFYHGERDAFGGLDHDRYRVLCLCDGEKTVDQICQTCTAGGDRKKLFLHTIGLLKNLHQAGLLHFSDPEAAKTV